MRSSLFVRPIRGLVSVAMLSVAACGGGSKSSDPPPSTPPAAPTGLVATAGDARVSLVWNASAGATGYKVRRSVASGGPYLAVASPTSTSHEDAALPNGTAFYYVVRAVNAAGESGDSPEANATPTAAPVAPQNLVATAGDGQVALSWDPVAGATSYEAHRDAGCTGTFSLRASPATTSYTDGGLTNGTTYCYVVKARNGAGAGPASAQAQATPQATLPPEAPPPPASVVATAGDGQVVVEWSASTGATGYVVERALAPGGSYAQVATPAGTTLTDTGLGNGRTYFYVVSATSDAGRGARSAEASATPLSGREICVSDEKAHTVSAFDPTSTGDLAPLRRLGNLTELEEVRGLAFDAVNDELYVANANWTDLGQWSVLVYQRAADGNVVPVRHLGGPTTQLRGAYDVAVDAVHDELFVSSGGKIVVFARTATGDATPLRVLTPASAAAPAIAVDPAHDELFVAEGSSIQVFARTAQGSASSLRAIWSSTSGMIVSIRSVAFASELDELVVLDGSQYVMFFPRTSTGAVLGGRSIYYWSTAHLTNVRYIAVDALGGVYVTSNQGVVFFDSTATDATPPSRTIAGPGVGFTYPSGVALDASRGELFVGGSTARVVVAHGATATGNVAPLRTISGTASRVDAPAGIAAAPAAGKVVVANPGVPAVKAPSVATFETPWSGAPLPAATLEGAATGLVSPKAVAVDEVNGETFVASRSANGDTVTVYPIAPDGNAAPKRTLALGATSRPVVLAVDPVNDELWVGFEDGALKVFARDASGSATPLRGFNSGAYYAPPSGLAVDTANGEVVVAGNPASGAAIAVFPRTRTFSGNPTRLIAGAATQLSGTSGLVLDVARNELLVTNATTRAITVHARTANGNAAPLRTLSGAATRMMAPSGIAACK